MFELFASMGRVDSAAAGLRRVKRSRFQWIRRVPNPMSQRRQLWRSAMHFVF